LDLLCELYYDARIHEHQVMHSFCVCTPTMKQTAVFSHLYLSVCDAAKHGGTVQSWANSALICGVM